MKTAHANSILLGALLLAPGMCAQSVAKTGQAIPDYKIHGLIGNDGRTRISELIGQPVIIAGFKTHLVTGLHAAKVATDLREKYGKKGLVVILEDRNKWRGKDPGSNAPQAFWLTVAGFVPWMRSFPPENKTRDYPIQRSAARDERSMILIGVDGRLILEGATEPIKQAKKKKDFRARLAKLVAVEISRRKKGWGKDAAAKKARSLAFGKDKLGSAMRTLLTEGSEAIPERVEAGAQLETHFAARVTTIRYSWESGRFLEAQDAIKRLSASVKGHEPWQVATAELAKVQSSPQSKAEIKLDRKLTKMLTPLLDSKKKSKLDAEMLGKLRVFGAKHASTKVGARAQRMDKFVANSLSGLLGMRIQKLEEITSAYVAKHQRK
jgi:hypothetical protein